MQLGSSVRTVPGKTGTLCAQRSVHSAPFRTDTESAGQNVSPVSDEDLSGYDSLDSTFPLLKFCRAFPKTFTVTFNRSVYLLITHVCHDMPYLQRREIP